MSLLGHDFDTCTVHIPNQEVQKEFINCIEDGGWESVMDAIRKSEELLAATIRGEEETVARSRRRAIIKNKFIVSGTTQPTDIQTGKAGFQICTESRVSEENDRKPGTAAGDVRKTGIVI